SSSSRQLSRSSSSWKQLVSACLKDDDQDSPIFLGIRITSSHSDRFCCALTIIIHHIIMR
ncbi:MAG: hypothetical protein WCD28_04655, partial [Nitrososphaeraceae archaeon]